MSKHKPVIVIRKKAAAHGGHHGGAWKVAYADFVTAMMSLFIVLWLMNTTPQVKKAVAGYFRNPLSSSAETGTDRNGVADNFELSKHDIQDLKDKIQQAMQKQTQLKELKNQVQVTVTPEGLRIELLEKKNGTFFQNGSAQLSQNGEKMLQLLAGQLGQVPNKISIEGYTDAKPYVGKSGYTNWNLSVDRANAARVLMQSDGLKKGQVEEVRGYGDNHLRLPKKPFDPSNRRVSIIVHYVTLPAGAQVKTETMAGKGAVKLPSAKAADAKAGGGSASGGGARSGK
ncbi:MAG: flagellar motor protein MotB [Acidobacteriaceae bacterium]